MVHGKGSKGKILEEKQLKRYRRSLKRTRATPKLIKVSRPFG